MIENEEGKVEIECNYMLISRAVSNIIILNKYMQTFLLDGRVKATVGGIINGTGYNKTHMG